MFFFKRNEAIWPSLRTFSLFREGHTLNAIYHRSLYFSCLLTGYRFRWVPRSVKHKLCNPLYQWWFFSKSFGHLLQIPFTIRQKCPNTRFESGLFGAVVERSWRSSDCTAGESPSSLCTAYLDRHSRLKHKKRGYQLDGAPNMCKIKILISSPDIINCS